MIRDFFLAAIIVVAFLFVCAEVSERDGQITYVKD
jgi:hypothetical protein